MQAAVSGIQTAVCVRSQSSPDVSSGDGVAFFEVRNLDIVEVDVSPTPLP